MLIKDDLIQIATIVDQRLEQQLDKHLSSIEKHLAPIEKDLKYIKKKVNRIDKTLNLVVKNYDGADVKLDRRVHKIEQHLNLS